MQKVQVKDCVNYFIVIYQRFLSHRSFGSNFLTCKKTRIVPLTLLTRAPVPIHILFMTHTKQHVNQIRQFHTYFSSTKITSILSVFFLSTSFLEHHHTLSLFSFPFFVYLMVVDFLRAFYFLRSYQGLTDILMKMKMEVVCIPNLKLKQVAICGFLHRFSIAFADHDGVSISDSIFNSM